jgi:uncharacterized protein with HEPN domain
VLRTASEILDWTVDLDFEAYWSSTMLRRAVERNFDILSEAVKEAERRDRSLTDIIPDIGEIKALHVILAHRYFTIDDQVIWDAVRSSLPEFVRSVRQLLQPPP